MLRVARAKINLTLQVTGKRDDGYHLLNSIVVFTDFGDEISAHFSNKLSLKMSGPFAQGLNASDDNLVLKAAHLLQQKCNVNKGAELRLEKNLPLASGIGGGSADAAATLHLLNEFWNLDLSLQELQAMALPLGADVPVCLLSKAALMQGIGEQITPLPITPNFSLLLVNPHVAVSTPMVFKAIDIQNGQPEMTQSTAISDTNLLELVHKASNDLQSAAVNIVPEIQLVFDQIEQLPGCRLARMSGSGATCFGIFDSLPEATAAAAAVSSYHPQWWTQATCIR
jgi:4-diphosphocytidyl-2-C-methyl-D-erythritol kinase